MTCGEPTENRLSPRCRDNWSRSLAAAILHNNTTDIQPERHSTDTHGTNQVNFWLLFFDGYGTTAFNAISVSVQNGVVSLGGSAYGPVDKQSALIEASYTAGVKDVIDNIKVDPDRKSVV